MKLAGKAAALVAPMLLIGLLVLIPLVGCGGGGGSSATPTAQHVGVMVTDAFTDQYSSVVVTIYKIEASTDGVHYVTAYENDGGTSIDVAQLAPVVELLGTVSLPSGTYTHVRVTTGSNISATPVGITTAVSLPISPTIAQITAGKAVITYNQSQVIVGGSNLIVDFNLAGFTVTTSAVIPDLQAGNPSKPVFDPIVASIFGTVTALNGGAFALSLPSGDIVPVTITANTRIYNAAGNPALIANGEIVRVDGPVDPATLDITANDIEVGLQLNGPYTTPLPSTIDGNGGTTTGGSGPPNPPS